MPEMLRPEPFSSPFPSPCQRAATERWLAIHAVFTAMGRFRNGDQEEQRLWRKFRQMRELPEKDQRAIFRMVNSLTLARGNGHGAGGRG